MASETPLLDALTDSLVADLTAVVPNTWKVWDAEGGAVESLSVVLYYEQGDLATTFNGQPCPPHHVGVTYTLTVTAPEKDPEKGTRTATEAVLVLLPALDSHGSIFWDRATKVRLETGETVYRLEIIHLSRFKKE
ncbi:hypothetical protein [Microbacterium sp. Mcb102]|uniref:hypothetical protein n=1 Tax=Microbacterium sp. Mcb102 TaxID=2926012 RepID=UPI0021C74228|nr:hypothetical protein [Microbacterium sp. Mcb102]